MTKKQVVKPVPARRKLQLVSKRWVKYVETPLFSRLYVWSALAILLATTVFWTLRSVGLQFSNADQLVNPFMFNDQATFKAAIFPEAHSFLIKWPLFWLVKLLGYSSTAFGAVTLGAVLFTVGLLIFILWRIERRPLVLGSLCLAVASILLLVPAQPYAGGLLPVNMAMLATRNIEYVVYIASLIVMVKSPSLRSRKFWLGVALLTVLTASDRLFVSLSLGGSLLALIAYALTHHWKMVSLAVRWLIASVVATVASTLILWTIAASRITHIVGNGGEPYGLVRSAHDLALAVIYALLGLATNLGANPAHDATRLKDLIPHAWTKLFRLDSLGFIINFAVLAIATYLLVRLVASTLVKHQKKALDEPSTLALMLAWSSLAAGGIFVLSNHYYAVDARYLSITTFALLISMAVILRKVYPKPLHVALIGGLLGLGIVSGLFAANHNFTQQSQALSDINKRNKSVTQALAAHPVHALVGDYWRVIPVKQQSPNKINVMPLANCTQGRDVLTSAAWNLNLNKHSFAYLLSADKSLTDFPQCSLDQIIALYGRPNASTVVAGNLGQPKETLLFYDRGAHKSSPSPSPVPQQAATVTPIAPEELPYTSCVVPTIMNIVAHEDDDLLFMNPDLSHDIQSGHCVRTIYVTAGDDGADKFYWLGRQRGSEAAYSMMFGTKNEIWIERIVKLSNHQYATVANPRGNSKVSIILLHLPDGNLKGEGFRSNSSESLSRLESGRISTIHTVDGQSSYTSKELAAALSTFMHLYQPAEIRTQANYISTSYPDHSDHMAVGRYVKKAYKEYEQEQYEGRLTIPLRFYMGYPVRELPANVSDVDLLKKQQVFFNYGRFDHSVCGDAIDCSRSATYSSYLNRQYQNPY